MKIPGLFSIATALVAALPLAVRAQDIPLAAGWQGYDPNGLLVLSTNSPSGFTARIANNTAGGNLVLPRIYNNFTPQIFTNYGTRVAVTFDLIFNDATVVGDTQFRFGLCNTSVNELIWVGYDIGAPNGTCIRERMEPSSGPGITTPGPFIPGNWNNAFISSPNLTQLGIVSFVSSSSFPNGVGLGVSGSLSTVHSFRYSVERVPGQLMQDVVWSNNAGHNSVGVSGAYNELANSTNTPQTWQQIDAFAFGCNSPGIFGTVGGSYTVSNLKIYNGFAITATKRDPATGDVVLTWESSPYDRGNGAYYQVQYTTNLAPPVTWNIVEPVVLSSVDQNGYWTSFTNSGTTDVAQFYRVQKIYQ